MPKCPNAYDRRAFAEGEAARFPIARRQALTYHISLLRSRRRPNLVFSAAGFPEEVELANPALEYPSSGPRQSYPPQFGRFYSEGTRNFTRRTARLANLTSVL